MAQVVHEGLADQLVFLVLVGPERLQEPLEADPHPVPIARCVGGVPREREKALEALGEFLVVLLEACGPAAQAGRDLENIGEVAPFLLDREMLP